MTYYKKTCISCITTFLWMVIPVFIGCSKKTLQLGMKRSINNINNQDNSYKKRTRIEMEETKAAEKELNQLFEQIKDKLKQKNAGAEEQKEQIKLTFITSICRRLQPQLTFARFLNTEDGIAMLSVIQQHKIRLSSISNLLYGPEFEASVRFTSLFDKLFRKVGNDYITTAEFEALKDLGFRPSNISGMLINSGAKVAGNFDALVTKILIKDPKDPQGNYIASNEFRALKASGFQPSNISSMLINSGTKVAGNFDALVTKILIKDPKDPQGNYIASNEFRALKVLGLQPSNISDMLSKSGAKVAKAFDDLVAKVLIKNSKGNYIASNEFKALKAAGLQPSNISSIVNNSGAKVAKAFDDLVAKVLKKDPKAKYGYIKSAKFEALEASAKLQPSNISHMLSKSGAKVADNFDSLINDFIFDVDFKDSNRAELAEPDELGALDGPDTLDGPDALDALDALDGPDALGDEDEVLKALAQIGGASRHPFNTRNEGYIKNS